MNAAQRLLLLLGEQSLEAYLRSLGFEIFFRLLESSGSTIINSGAGGSALDGTLLNAPSRVVGPIGGGYDFNAVNHAIRVDDGTPKDAIEESASQTFSLLWKPRSGGSLHILSYDNTDRRFFFSGGLLPRGRYSRGTTAVNTTSSTALDTDVVQWLHMVMDSDFISLYRDAGTLTELSYSDQTAGAGTQTSSATDLYFGNRSTLDLAVDAEVYALVYGTVALTEAQMTQIGALTPGLG